MKAALLAGAATKASKAKTTKRDHGDLDVEVQGTAPPPATGAPYIAKLKRGPNIVLHVNTKHATDQAVRELLGRRKEDDDEVERTVRGYVFRDLQSPYPDSVRVETAKGELVGWVVKANSYYACELINQVGDHLAGDPVYRGRAPKLSVSMFIEGAWEEEDGDTYVPSLYDVEIRIAAPVDIQDVDPLTPVP